MKFKTLAYGVMAYLCLAFHVSPTPLPSGATVTIGISSIEKVAGWNSGFCQFEAGDQWYNPDGTRVELKNLVEDPYFGSEHNWWMEAWVFGEHNCIDDDTYGDFNGSNFNEFCVEFSTETQGGGPTSVTFQVVSECSPFCNGTSPSGTWYKGQTTIDPFNFGDRCANGSNQIALLLQPRVECFDIEKRWGCGPDEFQD